MLVIGWQEEMVRGGERTFASCYRHGLARHFLGMFMIETYPFEQSSGLLAQPVGGVSGGAKVGSQCGSYVEKRLDSGGVLGGLRRLLAIAEISSRSCDSPY